jgi:endonuclease YncB( thermonuclease family)
MIRAALGVALATACIVAAYQTLAPLRQPEPVRLPPDTLFALRDLRPAVGLVIAQAEKGSAAKPRDVTPPDMTAGPALTAPAPASPPTAKPPPEKPPPARVERLRNPIVAAAGVIMDRGRAIRLAGIAAPAADARCGEGAAEWPCGRMARTALRRLVRGRDIECDVPAGAGDVPSPAECRVAGRNLSGWLIAQGWAKRDGERFAETEASARARELGIWGKARPGAQATPAPPPPPESSPDSALSIRLRVSSTP